MYSAAIGWVLATTSGANVIQPEIADDSAVVDASSQDTSAVETSDDSSSTDAALSSEDSSIESSESSSTVTASASVDGETTFDDEDDAAAGFESDDGGMDASMELEEAGLAPKVGASGSITPFDGRLGVGAIRTIAGLNGVNIRYFITDQFMIGTSLGVALFAYKENEPGSTDVCPGMECNLENNRTIAFVAANIEALYFLHLGREAGALPFRADFGLGGRFGVMTLSNDTDINNNLDDPTELHVEIPLVFQLMFGNNFALSPEMGMDFRIVPGSREEGDSNPGITQNPSPGPGFGWDLTPGIGLFAGVSMHYYFGG